MNEGAPCEFLEWDSNFFGRRIARVRGTQRSAGEIQSSLEWFRAERIECLYLLAPSADTHAIQLIEEYGQWIFGTTAGSSKSACVPPADNCLRTRGFSRCEGGPPPTAR
jgi:hypothetical protein